jgi:hypothetical protein
MDIGDSDNGDPIYLQIQCGIKGLDVLFFLTSVLEGVGGQCHALTTLPLGNTRYTLNRRLGGPQGWSG